MENKPQNATERRLAQVRALKDRYFADELSIEERLEAKDARIALLENQVLELHRRLEKIERQAVRATQPRPDRPAQRAPRPERHAPLFESEQPGFDFYRD